jgi:hypothetical protein
MKRGYVRLLVAGLAVVCGFVLSSTVGRRRDADDRTKPPFAPTTGLPALSMDQTLATWVARYGPPDEILSTDEERPRPRFPFRVLTYRRQGVRAAFATGFRERDAVLPPHEVWKLYLLCDPVTLEQLTPAVAAERMALRTADEMRLTTPKVLRAQDPRLPGGTPR